METVDRFVPPGFCLKREIKLGLIFLAAAACVLLIGFLVLYLQAWGEMYYYVDGRRAGEIPGAVFAAFKGMAMPGVVAYLLASVAFLAMLGRYLGYHYRGGSRAIYTMRRVPSRFEFMARCCAVPAAGLAACQLCWRLLLLLCGLIYAFATPERWLAADAWESVLYLVTH